jgi:hypothetical protein
MPKSSKRSNTFTKLTDSFRHWLLGDVNQNLQYVWIHLIKLEERINAMSESTDLLKEEVASLSTVVDSAVALIQGLADRLKDVTTLEEVQAIVADLEKEKTELAAAVQANT